MCGISVILSNNENGLQDIFPMTDAIKHRGPDDVGYVFFAKKMQNCEELDVTEYDDKKNPENWVPHNSFMALGHRRLSIVDLTKYGHQPMCDESKNIWITYNGEIFNFNEIKSELKSFGYKFYTDTDTEVILYAYKHWGPKCLHRFNGMWAFVIYDIKANKIFIARDRFGVKPLYYWISPNSNLAISSEIKQFTFLQGWSAKANLSKICNFLSTGAMDYDSETMFEGVSQVLPGHYIEICLNNISNKDYHLKQTQWYCLPLSERSDDFNDVSGTYRTLFFDAVRIRSVSDVPLGSCLSGGLDSSSIVCALNELQIQQDKSPVIKTFTMLSEKREISEKKWVEAVIQKTNSQSFNVTPNAQDCLDSLRTLVWNQDEPFGSLGIYGQSKVFQLAASQNIKVMLDGQGADEYLAGYDGFYSAYMNEIFASGNLKCLYNEFGKIQKFRKYSLYKVVFLFGNAILPTKISDFLKKILGYRSSHPNWLNSHSFSKYSKAKMQNFSNVRDLSIDLLTKIGVRALLHWEDRNSMAYSIEARVPFLDYRLVEFVLPLKSKIKITDGITKKILRDSMRGILPDLITDRKDKLGFSTDSDDWMSSIKMDEFRELLCDGVKRSNGLVSSSVINEFEISIDRKSGIPGHIWRIICFGIWVDVFNVQIEVAQ
jgi:asparagine synthase (glutamine-hydrolysing)